MPVRTKDKKNTALFFWKGYHGTKSQTERDQYRRKHPYMTREMLVKIERGIQHITGAQLKGIRDCLNTTYDELLKEVHS